MNVIGIYPSICQPPHLGDVAVYNYLKRFSGNNTFIATTDKIEMPQHPLNFQDKQQIWTKHGVPINKIFKTNNPYQAIEITRKFGSDRTAVLVAIDVEEVDKYLTMSGGYYLLYRRGQTLEPLNKHAYIIPIKPDLKYIDGRMVNTDTINKGLSSSIIDLERKKSFFKQIFGWYDIGLFNLMTTKFSEAGVVKERINERLTKSLKELLKPYVKDAIDEFVQTQGNSTVPDQSFTNPTVTTDPNQLAIDKRNKRDELTGKIKDLQKQLTTLKNKRKNDLETYKNGFKSITGQLDDTKKALNTL